VWVAFSSLDKAAKGNGLFRLWRANIINGEPQNYRNDGNATITQWNDCALEKD